MPNYDPTQPRLGAWRGFRQRLRQGSLVFALGSSLRIAITLLGRRLTSLWLNLGPGRTFAVAGEWYRYLVHPYNTTWRNERCVEVPIVRGVLERSGGRRTLEVGHVLGHYFATSHDVLDKYEASPGVIAQDVADFRPARPYDLILSISTLEHVGLDEAPREPGKAARAIANLYDNCLAAGGELVFTVPLGYNPVVDRLLDQRELPLTRLSCLRRLRDGLWCEARWEDVRGTSFDFTTPTANALVVAYVRKPERDAAVQNR